tara:strand:- start:123 stop:365 length:243 start_codon:yes stop_codon:yes gene_type:complete
MKERLIIICECSSLDHQVVFWYDEEDFNLTCSINLTTRRNFIKRLWYGLRYAFGYKSRFGNFDETIFKDEDLIKLKEYLN